MLFRSPVAAWLGWLSLPLLLVVTLAAGAATVLFDVAYLSVLPSLVRREQVVAGNAALETSSSAAGVLGPGAVYQHTFASAGSYAYHCVFHAPMRGTVQVNASAADSIAHVSITSSTTTFPGATIRPGGSVTWTNNTQLDHTVTSD